jgi:predicted esterase
MVETRTIDTPTHGRYLVRVPGGSGPWPMLVGFHGYRENAAIHLATLESIPGSERWLLVAVQGLHRFYTKGGDVAASWMTREDRELAIADNVAYIQRVVAAVRGEFRPSDGLVFAGFSQGTAMAFRAAAHIRCAAVVALGADVPPDVAARRPVTLPRVLYGRGQRDELYSADAHAQDLATLNRLAVPVESVTYDGAHEWTAEFLAAVGRTLRAIAAAA